MAQDRPMNPLPRNAILSAILEFSSRSQGLDVAADAERLARNVPAGRRAEEEHHAGDVLRRHLAAQRDLGEILLLHRREVDAEGFGTGLDDGVDARALDHAGQDRVDADALRPEL